MNCSVFACRQNHCGNDLSHLTGTLPTFHVLGYLERWEQDFAGAQAAFEQSLSCFHELGSTGSVVASVLHNLAYAHLHQGDLNQAHKLFRESLSMHQEQRNAAGLVGCLIGFGAMASICGMPVQAARLLAAAIALGGKALLTQWPPERMEYEYYLAAIRTQVTNQEFEEAQMSGCMLTMEQAIEYALSLPLLPATPTHEEFGGLTEREREIAALIVQGKRNSEIAEQLVLSKRTVEKHVANILSKLELTSRAQIVRWAMEHHLTSTSS